MPELLEDATVEAIRRRAKWENDDYICRGHILNGMSDSLFDVYTNVESAKELWDSLESKYMAEDSSSKKFLSISVSSIIDKLPPSWKDFKHTLKHGKDDLSLVQLGSHLRIGIIHETTASYTPQQNGVAEKKNRALKKMVNSMVPNKRNKTTPYELWYKKRPNLSFLRVWGYRAVVRLPDLKRKTLGEKGIDCIFVGYAEHSKAYRFYVIEPNDSVSINSIIESREAIDDEIGSIMENNTWVLSDLPPGCKPLDCKWIFKRKMKVDGTIDKFKARLVIQDFRQKEGIDYFDTYAPVARITTIRLLLALAAIHNLVIHQMDVKTTFLNGNLDEEVYMKQPKRFVMSDQLEYSRAIGCLMYALTSTRPDIAYAVGRLSRFTSNPSRQHWKAITRVFKYLRALAAAGKEAEWLRNLIYEILIWPKPIAPISIRCDSAPTMARAYSQIYNGKSRHLGVRHSM
ncbi:zinc finger, CCHC-type containing protein, partial [Tanacetum coccineum]